MARFASCLISVQLALALVLAAALAGATAIGYAPYVVLSSSMEPAVPAGSLSYVDTRLAPSGITAKVKAGDIVTFWTDESTTVTHRVVSVDEGACELVVKGDANAAADPHPVAFTQVVGRVVLCVPYAGALLDAFAAHKGAWLAVLVLFNASLLVLPRFLGEGRAGDDAQVL